jgi:hypothetical protein
MPRFGLGLALAALLAGAASAEPAAAKKRTPAPTATPTPAPLLRAAGSCLFYAPGKNVVLAEVGTTGRVFRIDAETRLETKVRVGARLRILYVEGPEGPLARRVFAGPVPDQPTPTPGANP